jgi:excisionase family DNA binding protein
MLHQAPNVPAKLVTDRDVQEQTGLSARTIYNYRKEGKLPYVMFGNRIRYKPEDVQRFIESQIHVPTTGTNAPTHFA